MYFIPPCKLFVGLKTLPLTSISNYLRQFVPKCRPAPPPTPTSIFDNKFSNSTTALNPTLNQVPLNIEFKRMPVDELVESLASVNSPKTSKSQLSIGPLYHEFEMMPVDELVSILSSGNFNSAINFIPKIEDNLLNTSFNLNKTELISLLEKINNINESVNDTDLKEIFSLIYKISNSKLKKCLTDAFNNKLNTCNVIVVYFENNVVRISDDAFNKLLKIITCPITTEQFQVPMCTKYGHTFESVHIIQWVNTKQTCPLTRQELKVEDLVKNSALDELIKLIDKKNQFINKILELPDEPVIILKDSTNNQEVNYKNGDTTSKSKLDNTSVIYVTNIAVNNLKDELKGIIKCWIDSQYNNETEVLKDVINKIKFPVSYTDLNNIFERIDKISNSKEKETLNSTLNSNLWVVMCTWVIKSTIKEMGKWISQWPWHYDSCQWECLYRPFF